MKTKDDTFCKMTMCYQVYRSVEMANKMAPNLTCFAFFTQDTDNQLVLVLLLILILLMLYIVITNLIMMLVIWNATKRFKLPERLLMFFCARNLLSVCLTIPIEIYVLINRNAHRCFVIGLTTFTMSQSLWITGWCLVSV